MQYRARLTNMKKIQSIIIPLGLFACALSVEAIVTERAAALGTKEKAPNFAVKADGIKDLKSLKGKVVLVDFWAHWCKPCKEELPVLQKLHQKYKAKGLVVVGVNIDRDAKDMKKFLKRLEKQKGDINFPMVRDADKAVADKYQPETMPSSYLIDKNGTVIEVFSGYRKGDEKDMERKIKAALSK